MQYNIYIGKNYINIFNPDSNDYLLIKDKIYKITPFGIYDEINDTPYLDKLTRFFIKFNGIIEPDSNIAIGLDNYKESNFGIIRNALQKAGFYKTVYSALKHITFVDTSSFNIDYDDIKNSNVAEFLEIEDKNLYAKKVESSYGLYDSSIKSVREVIPAKTKIDDLYFNKKACHDYQYYIDVE
jgi:hypothetical protein